MLGVVSGNEKALGECLGMDCFLQERHLDVEMTAGVLTLCHVNSPLKKSYILRSASLFSGFDVRLFDLYKKLLPTFAFYNCRFILKDLSDKGGNSNSLKSRIQT